MKIIIPVQIVPDPVEGIAINKQETGFELAEIAWKQNEFDDHAVEEGILLKEKYGGEVVVVAAGGELAEEGLFTAAARGADRLIKVNIDFASDEINNHALARIFHSIIKDENADLVLTGVSNPNGYDGPVGALLAEFMGVPYIGYVSGVEIEGKAIQVLKDYPGGVKVKLETEAPAVLGISSSHEPPKYVPVSKVRQAMKTASPEEVEAELDLSGGLASDRMYEPEAGGKAEMLSGDLRDIADRMTQIIKSKGLI